MNHILRSRLLIDGATVEISLQQFEEARAARQTLVSGFDLEEIFDHLVSNFLEIETRCLSSAVQRLARDTGSYNEFYQQRAPINLAFVNFLSTARLYVDQVGSKALACVKDAPSVRIDVKALLAREYDASFDFRFIEALRNHVQHSGTAVHIVRSSWRNLPTTGLSESEVYVVPFSDRRFLAEDGKFKASVLAECPDTVNLLSAARTYVGAICLVHREIRDSVEPSLLKARSTIESLQTLLAGNCEGAPDALVAVAVDDAGNEAEEIPMLLEWERVREWLRRRNVGLTAKRYTYATGRGER